MHVICMLITLIDITILSEYSLKLKPNKMNIIRRGFNLAVRTNRHQLKGMAKYTSAVPEVKEVSLFLYIIYFFFFLHLHN